jgi:hypothetical protein
MANMMLAYPDKTVAATLSEGSWLAGLPLNNLKDRQLATVARSSDDAEASTKFKADLGSAIAIRTISLYKHNLSDSAQVRVTGSNNSDMSAPVYSGSWVTVPAALTAYQKVYTVILTADTTARYWRIEISDTSNPSGYVELSRCVIAPAWVPTIGMSYGSNIAPSTDTTVERSLGGVDYFDRREPRRTSRFTLDSLLLAEAMATLDMQMDLGIDGEFLFVYEATDTGRTLMRRSWLATLRQLSAIEHPAYDRHTVAYEVKEVL